MLMAVKSTRHRLDVHIAPVPMPGEESAEPIGWNRLAAWPLRWSGRAAPGSNGVETKNPGEALATEMRPASGARTRGHDESD
jgi:hypothetical protein